MPNEACPNCQSSDWKSAKMIVLQGTTFSEVAIDGKVTDPGAFSLNARAFLLSDRWFSWEYQIDADINITTHTALVGEVKKMLIEKAAGFPVPLAPTPPQASRPLSRITPVQPIEPSRPHAPPPPLNYKWRHYFSQSYGRLFGFTVLIGSIVVMLALMTDPYLAAYALFLVLLTLLIGLPVCYFHSLKGNERALIDYEQAQRSHRSDLEKYERALAGC